ncbi:hypothetical protein GCM10022289_15500 [Pedobacter jeongneungensis]|uniref:YD repeat-containing protein n=1 Tax=Pedobacter jeongneungensis TaxID=947309 RepID=A0ABP8BB94_9SPHI
MKFNYLIYIILTFVCLQAKAQPYLLKSTDSEKSFQLHIYYGSEGKGAFVQYVGQKGIIPLEIRTVHVKKNAGNNVPTVYYSWDELMDGKITGNYSLNETTGKIFGAVYKRLKDGRIFKLEQITGNSVDNTQDKLLVNNVLITFSHNENTQLTFNYEPGKRETLQLEGFDNPQQFRKSHIADYNFDGHDDVGFSIPDAGMGVYRTYTIFLYDPVSKRFKKLKEPTNTNAQCLGLCDVKLDTKNKLFFTSCRGGARWWSDVYRFDKANKLIWLRSKEEQ